MEKHELLINQIAQDKIDFDFGAQLLLDKNHSFEQLFKTLHFYILNSIPDKIDYNSETYQTALNTIPLKPTYTPIVILQRFPTKIAFKKLASLPSNESQKIIISLLWIF